MKIAILFSDTGGGHRAASRAIEAALGELDPTIRVELVDALVRGGPWPLNRAPRIYEWWMRRARFAWAFFFHLWNGPIRARIMADLGYPFLAGRLKRLLRELEADVIVSTHPLLTRSVARARRSLSPTPPFAIVVTDMVSGHWSWYDRGADRIFVPTEESKATMLAGGFEAARIDVTGQTVHPRCGRVVARRDALRAQLGWQEPVILMVGGGDGMGGLGKIARAVVAAKLAARVVVVCGRNERLRAELATLAPSTPFEVKGFVDNLHELMAAADILVTKGGPGSIMEGAVAGLPMLLYDFIPGQELGNVRFVEAHGLGRFVKEPTALVAALEAWLADPAARARAAEASRAVATPDSATAIARGILRLAGRGA